ncbi:hypothetical protein [Nitrosomonas sp.]|uniref:hypothetical protein n=1 Tax=Nitrosomonas sp. TaxID=42353 RepID=UPI002604431D|nr:hypothetical protein [Nitrosomonas sp.]
MPTDLFSYDAVYRTIIGDELMMGFEQAFGKVPGFVVLFQLIDYREKLVQW